MLNITKLSACLQPIMWHVENTTRHEFSAHIAARSQHRLILILLIHPQGTRSEHGFRDRRFFAKMGLATLLDEDVEAIDIKEDLLGCPQIFVHEKPCPWFVSFAARNRYSLIGIAQSPLGVDIECKIHPSAIPWNLLRIEERDALNTMPEGVRVAQFLALWCQKEAILKALGTGFRVEPEKLVIPLARSGWQECHLDFAASEKKRRLHICAQALHLTKAVKPAFSLYEMCRLLISKTRSILHNRTVVPERENDIDLTIAACVLEET